MANAYDGTMELGVRLKPTDIQKTARQLRKDVASIFDSTDASKLDSKMSNIQATMSKLSKASRDLSQEMRAMASQKIPTEDYVEIQKQIEKAKNDLVRFNKQQELMEATGTKSGKAWDRLKYKIDEVSASIPYLEGELQDLVDTGKAFTLGAETDEYKKKSDQLNEVNNKLVIQKARWQEAASKIRESGDAAKQAGTEAENALDEVEQKAMHSTTTVAETLKMMPKVFGTGFKAIIAGIPAAVMKIASAAKTAAGHVAKLTKNLISAAGRAIRNGLSRVANSIRNIGRHAKTSNLSVGKLLKRLLTYGLGIGSLYMLFNRLRGAITGSLQSLAQFNDGNNETNKSISMLVSSLNYLKNSLGAAFAPILTVIAPTLSRFIDMLAEATNKIGMFFAALSGKNVFTKAKKVQTDYTKSLQKTGKELDEVNGKLGEYDKLSVIGQEDKNSGADGTGISEMFEDVPISSVINDWVKKFKEAWENADFYDIGRIVGEKLRDALNSINWDSIKDFAWRLAHSLGTFINGFIETEGLGDAIGRTIAEAINTAITFVNTFLTTVHWDSVGKFFGDIVNSWIKAFDFTGFFMQITNALNALADFLVSFADTVEWKDLGTNIANGINDALSELNADKLARGISGFITGILDAIISFITTTNWTQVGEKLAEFIANLDWKGIVDRVGQGFSALVDAIFDLLSGLFGDADPGVLDVATAAVELFRTALEKLQPIAEGIYNNFLKPVGEFAWNVISDALQTIADLLSDITDVLSGEKTLDEFIKELTPGEAILGSIATAIGLVATALGVFAVVAGIASAAGSVLAGVIAFLTSPITLVIAAIAAIIAIGIALYQNWDEIKRRAQAFWADVKEGFGKLKDDIGKKVDTIKEKFTTAVDNVKKKFEAFKTFWVGVWNTIKNTIVGAWNTIWNTIKSKINSILAGIEKMVNGIISGLNWVIKKLNMIKIEPPEWVTERFGIGTLGFNLPELGKVSLPRLAQGAVIPPNKEFLAMLGDQKQGTNIETPLNTMIEAFKAALAEEGSSNHSPIVLQLDGKTVAKVVWDETDKKYKQTGKYIPSYV